MRQAKPRKKNDKGSTQTGRDEESTSFKRLGGRNLKEEGGDEGDQAGAEDTGEDSPSMSERADAGVKAAGHLGKAASGGKLRMAYSLWRASKHIPVAAAGAGDLIKRHPAITALVAGVTAAAVTYVMASRAAAAEGDEGESQSEGEGDGDAEEKESERPASRSKSRA